MKIRLAVTVEAEECWNIRNQAIRYGCKNTYDDAVIAAWTPEKMPESYRNVIVANPFSLLMSLMAGWELQAFLICLQAVLRLYLRYLNIQVKG